MRPHANGSRRVTVLVITAAALLLAGCSSSSTDSGTLPAVSDFAVGAPTQDASVKSSQDRSIVRMSSVTVRVDQLVEAADRYRALAQQFGGEVSDEYLGNDGASPYATLTAKIPAERLSDFISHVREFGQVLAESTSANDVTLAVADVNARVNALTESTARLRALLNDATKLADIVAIESELTTRQAELDGLRAQQRALEDQVAMSTVTATFTPEVADVAAPAPGFLAGLQTGWNALVSAASSATTLIGMLLPFAFIAAVLFASAVVIRRNVRRRPGRRAGRNGDDRAGVDRASE